MASFKIIYSSILIIYFNLSEIVEGEHKACYWRGFPWCGLMFRCKDDDYFMRYGMSGQCFLNFDKYCCPKIDGTGDFIYCKTDNFKEDCSTQTIKTKYCTNLKTSMQSVNTLGQCLRIYESINCEGRSIIVRPGTSSHNNLNDYNMHARSVSTCFTYDTCETGTRKKRSSNNCQFINDLTIGFLPWLMRDRDNLQNSPVSYYQIGPNGRTEVMEAEIYRYHLNTGTSTNNAARIFARNMGNSNDQAGHILASRLGGSGTDLRNIFPQNPHMNMGLWRSIENDVYNMVLNSGFVRFTINLLYEDRSSTRPYSIVYRIQSNTPSVYDGIIHDISNTD